MAEMILKKTELSGFMEKLADAFDLYGPVKTNGRTEFAAIDSAPDLDYSNSKLSPKNMFFPQTENMFSFSIDNNSDESFILKEIENPRESKLVFGIRPCDAKAFSVLDRIFVNDQYSDTFWQTRRDSTVLMGLGCSNPCPTCFCTSVGSGPFHEEGLDILCVDLGDDLLIKSVNEKGEKVLEQAGGLEAASNDALEKAKKIKEQAEKSIDTKLNLDKIEAAPVLDLFKAPHWEQVQERCLNCGVCTYVCPTCHCFDIQDETSGTDGLRMRNWDSCMSWLFTAHGTGHNPRPDKTSRVRQRFMHKFKYIPVKRDGDIGCVGCGRCITACPVNIDVRDVAREMNR